MSNRKGIGGHHSARANTEVWLTPPDLLQALGGPETFALDPCAALGQPWPTARAHFTIEDDGLAQPWQGRVWLNPPYTSGVIGKWLGKLATHGDGIALTFARTETEAFHRTVWEQCDALLFLEGRLFFHVAEAQTFNQGGRDIFVPKGGRAPANGGAPSVLCAYGADCADILAESGLKGSFVPLRLRVLTFGFETVGTWVEEVLALIAGRNEPVTLDWLYRKLAGSPKARRNPNWKAKVRQTLQRGPFEALGGGVWQAATL
ncbi:MAG: adenine methyltransferase [Mesorhizobium sp.]|uniref:DNA N-6-adenine-methyltransferase n=1 Tax=Mesorhizobium sp. TaxID=1871066 RepID=UPI00121A5A6E|nr:DNA N-6-adenine-methyltransferase [Mesorhizobium sp.]TIR24004.1 MAG: adenine methyltransferase [Mesorhizobium sp.]